MTRGDIWWGDFPDFGRRPCLVLTRSSAIQVLRRVVVVPATTRIRGAPSEVLLDQDDGLPRECVLSFDNLETIPKAWLVERICVLRGERLVEVCRTLNRVLGC